MRSKVFIICIIICHSALSLVAQVRNDRFHGFGSESRRQTNAYFGPLVAFSNVEGSLTIDAGATGGAVINNKFFIGLYYQKILTNAPRTDLAKVGYPNFTDGRIKLIQGGGVLGYIHNTDKVLNWGVSASAGLGKITLLAKGPTNKYEDGIYNDQVIILIPKLFMEMKITRGLKINTSCGYRLFGMMNGVYTNPAGQTIPTFISTDYNKPEFSVSLLLGSFGFHTFLLK